MTLIADQKLIATLLDTLNKLPKTYEESLPDIVVIEKMRPDEQPLKLTPIQNGIEKPLHRAVTAVLTRPA